jgi:hypothetical protein
MPVIYYHGCDDEPWNERDIEADREAAAAWVHGLLKSIGGPAPNSETKTLRSTSNTPPSREGDSPTG